MTSIEQIKTAIMDREGDLIAKFSSENIIPRENEDEFKKLITTDSALVITGARRCGKSILAFMMGQEQKFGYVNFDDERLSLNSEELNKIVEAIYSLKGETELFIFDEIQNIVGWEKFVSRIIPNKKVVITGSNARLLSKELATNLTGRHIDITLFPFSFREFLLYKKYQFNPYFTKDKAKIKDCLTEYMEKGGFPLTYKLGNIFLLENYKDIIERDIVQRYNIKYVKVLKDLAKYLISNISNEISFNQLKNSFNVKSVHTIKNYIDYMHNTYLLFLLERFSFKLKEQSLAPKKVYCIDTGLVNAVGFRFSEKKGSIIENIVAIELMRKTIFNKKEIYYWKNHQQQEVDFVIKRDKKVDQLIQVTNASSELDLKKREIESLVKASQELKCNNLLVITWDYEAEKKHSSKKIVFIPLWKWLL